MLFIRQDKPIPLVTCSLRVNSFHLFFFLFFVPLVYQFRKENRRAVMSAYRNVVKSVLFLMPPCESALKFYGFLGAAAPTDSTLSSCDKWSCCFYNSAKIYSQHSQSVEKQMGTIRRRHKCQSAPRPWLTWSIQKTVNGHRLRPRGQLIIKAAPRPTGGQF